MKKKLKNQKSGKSKLFITAVVIFLCIGIVYGVKFVRRSDQKLEKRLHPRAIGNPDADVRIVEYIDFQCPPCAKGYFLLKSYLKKYPSRIYVELKYLPWTKKRHSLQSALFAECSAKQEKFWEYSHLLLQRQKILKKLSDDDAQLMFRKIANEIGLDEFELADCVLDELVKQTILSERNEGKSLGIRQTPTYFINGKMIVGFKGLQRELKAIFEAKQEEQPHE
jgi:protein-disulfide isomerase